MAIIVGGGGIAVILFAALAIALTVICGIRMYRARRLADVKIEQTQPGTVIVSPRPYFEPYRYQPPTPENHVVDMYYISSHEDTTTNGAGALRNYSAPSESPPNYPALAHVASIPGTEETERNSLPLSTFAQASSPSSSGVATTPSSQATPAVSAQ